MNSKTIIMCHRDLPPHSTTERVREIITRLRTGRKDSIPELELYLMRRVRDETGIRTSGLLVQAAFYMPECSGSNYLVTLDAECNGVYDDVAKLEADVLLYAHGRGKQMQPPLWTYNARDLMVDAIVKLSIAGGKQKLIRHVFDDYVVWELKEALDG